MIKYADHWLYHYIPHHRSELPQKSFAQKMTWALFGNDDDGIFGEGPNSGRRWTARWGGSGNKEIGYHNPGKINFYRFCRWQLRNPLHNFTGYVIGFKDEKNITIRQCFLMSTEGLSLWKRLPKANTFPMSNHTGVYVGLHNNRPFISWRVNLLGLRWLESYAGWRPRGGFGLAFRLKKTVKIPHTQKNCL